MQSLRLVSRIIALGLIVALALLTLVPGRQPALAAAGWNLANDFRLAPNQANPNPDGLGHAEVWEFRESTSLAHDPSTYHLLPTFITDAFGIEGLQEWHGTVVFEPKNVLARVGINATGTTQQASSITWPAGVVSVHPLPVQLVVVGWRSPIDGVVSVAGGVADMDANCGNGIAWSVDRGAATIASGSYLDGGQQRFVDGIGGASLAAVPVHTGDQLYFIVDPNGEYGCDSTALDVTITATTASNHVPDCSAAQPSMSTIRLPNGRFVPITIQGVTDLDQDSVAITITSIRQDEPVAEHGAPDGRGVGSATAEVRAERLGKGDGRVYHIGFGADDGRGGMCTSEVLVSVPHDSGRGQVAIDGGPIYDSTVVPARRRT
jgi:hypothetical protein